MTRLVAVLVGAVLVVSSVGIASGANPAYAPKNCTKPRIEPRTIVLACADFGAYVKVKRWRYWNGREAAGKGKLFAKDCVPSCAEGMFRKERVKVRLTKPRKRTCGGRKGVRMFQRLKLTFRGGSSSNLPRKWKLYCVP